MAQFFFGNVGVDLGGSNGAVAEEFLDLADVAGLAHEFEAYGVPERMGRVFPFQASPFHPSIEIKLNRPVCKTTILPRIE